VLFFVVVVVVVVIVIVVVVVVFLFFWGGDVGNRLLTTIKASRRTFSRLLWLKIQKTAA